MEILLLIAACFVAWRVYVAYLKKKAHEGYAELAATGDVDAARAEYAKVFEVLVCDFLGGPRLPPAEGLHFFDLARFLRCRIERGPGAAGQLELDEVGRRIRAEIATEATRRQASNHTLASAGAASGSEVAIEAKAVSTPIRELTLSEAATSEAGPRPRMVRSTHDRNVDIQGYRVTFYRDVTFESGEECPCVMVVFDPQPRCRLIVTAEANKSFNSRPERSHFLCAWTPERRVNYGASEAYGDFEEFMKFAILVAVRVVLIPDGLDFDETTTARPPSDELDEAQREAETAAGAIAQAEESSIIDWAIDRSPIIEIVRRFGGRIGEAVVRKDAVRFFQRLSNDGAVADSDSLLIARRAVQLSIHRWINDHADHLSPEAFQTYLDRLASD